MRTKRILMEGQGYYHVMSHLVAGTPRMGAQEKEQLRRLMRAYETFSGVRVLTYSILGTHFHILLDVPDRQTVTEEEVIRRMQAIYSPPQIRERLAQWSIWRQQGYEQRVQDDLDALRARMYDLSEFMKALKQRFSQWYNRNANRRGTLWEDRFKSIIVEGPGHALTTIAAYIDLNAVRAGLADDPKDYRWSGYAEALGGHPQARMGLQHLMASITGTTASWQDARQAYRRHLSASVQQGADNAEPVRPEQRTETIERKLREGSRLCRADLLRCRVRYFSDGVVLGSREFVNEVFRRHRGNFGPNRAEGARPLRFTDLAGLYSARDLRVRPITVSALQKDG